MSLRTLILYNSVLPVDVGHGHQFFRHRDGSDFEYAAVATGRMDATDTLVLSECLLSFSDHSLSPNESSPSHAEAGRL